MERIVHIANNHREAEKWDIKQAISMSSEDRQKVAKELKIRVYGKNSKDVKVAQRSMLSNEK